MTHGIPQAVPSQAFIPYAPGNQYGTMSRKLRHFDILIDSIRKAIENNDPKSPVIVKTEINPLNNSVSVTIEAKGLTNNWGEQFNITNEAHDNHVSNLSEQLENLIQELIPECDSDCCSTVDYDQLITELSMKVAIYSYNYTGTVTSESINDYLEAEKQRITRDLQRSRYSESKIDKDFEKAKYESTRIHYKGERGGNS